MDKIVEKGFKNNKSKIIQLEPNHDDIIGKEIFTKIFNKEKILQIKNTQSTEEIINKLTEDIIKIVNNINCDYNIY